MPNIERKRERARERERERERERRAVEKVPFATRCLAREASLIQGGGPSLTAMLLVQRNEQILLHVDSFAGEKGMDGVERGQTCL